ncbi:MAG: phosphopantothenoylcysteine decarboxylase [Desulfobacteraceae bacterium]|nr:phosphopantothenoylcysteine decarboxylase [Desulfobacteraceae bacterium]
MDPVRYRTNHSSGPQGAAFSKPVATLEQCYS